jgi:hypothetical protein
MHRTGACRLSNAAVNHACDGAGDRRHDAVAEGQRDAGAHQDAASPPCAVGAEERRRGRFGRIVHDARDCRRGPLAPPRAARSG